MSGYPGRADKVIYGDATNGFTVDDFADLCLAAADQAMVSVEAQRKIEAILMEAGRFPDGKSHVDAYAPA